MENNSAKSEVCANREIERKFLVRGPFKEFATSSSAIWQGYITISKGRTVRVRIRDNKAFLTIKGPSESGGLSRFEWEREISLEDAAALRTIALPGGIEKRRYIVPFGGHIFEVDEFFGANAGLVLAEVELQSENESFERPEWLGEEVTGNPRYYNSFLSGNRDIR